MNEISIDPLDLLAGKIKQTSEGDFFFEEANYTNPLYFTDKKTGLMWEAKTSDGLRGTKKYYTNYDNPNEMQMSDGKKPTQRQINAKTNTIGYAKAVNKLKLGGFNDWRLPTVEELEDLYDNFLENKWFQETQNNGEPYWSSCPDEEWSNYACFFYFDTIGYSSINRYSGSYVRLVRNQQPKKRKGK